MYTTLQGLGGCSEGSAWKGGCFQRVVSGNLQVKTSVGQQPLGGFATIAGFPGPNVAAFIFLHPGKLRDEPGKH